MPSWKRGLDILCALALLTIALPVMLILIALIVIESPGASPFFWQERVGYRGRHFRMVKLRTMVPDAEARLAQLQADAGLPGPVFKLQDDPRVTAVGRVLRRTGLDELPQLYNIIAGEMSLVGPRPLPPSQIDPSDWRFVRRTDVLPGLTGLWQVNGRAMHVDYDRWLDMDVRYVAEHRLSLDLTILVLTLPAVIRGDGAY